MKKYQKAKMIAKNLPTGSYAAGCPTYYAANEPWRESSKHCQQCERAY